MRNTATSITRRTADVSALVTVPTMPHISLAHPTEMAMSINFALNSVAVGTRLSPTEGPEIPVVRNSIVSVGGIFYTQALPEYGPLDLLFLCRAVVGRNTTLAE